MASTEPARSHERAGEGAGVRTDRGAAPQWLDETGVALASGTSFGIHGEGYIRFSYANSIENIEEAMVRIARFLKR